MIHYGKEPQTGDLNIIVPPDEVKEIYELINSTTLLQRRTFYGLKAYISGEYEVKDLKKAPYKEIFFDDQDTQADRYYKAKLEFITIDERTEKEKRSRVTYLVQARNLHRAMKNVDEVMSGTMIDYEACCIDDTKIIDVFEYQKQQADSEPDGKQKAAGE